MERIAYLKHSLQFDGVLVATGLLQFGYHRCLRIVGRRRVINQSFCQHFAVELLEYILVFDVFENDHDLVERVLELGFFRILAGFLQ